MSSQAIDTPVLQEMRGYIEKLTHSGQKVLDEKLLKSLKNICKLSDKYVERCYEMVIYELQKDHSEIRFSALQIIDELFRRSHCFRELLLSDMQQFMELTIEINNENPLPLPKITAKALKKNALQAIHEWNKKFGEDYKRLSLAYKFLKNCIKVDFKELEIQSSIEHQRQLEAIRKQKEMLDAKAKKIIKEIEENQPEIDQAITSMENCLSLLLPHPKEFFVDAENGMNPSGSVLHPVEDKISKEKDVCEIKESESVDNEVSSSDSESETDESINLREYGVLNPHYNIVIDLKKEPDKVKVTEENSVIAENARDLFVILNNRHLADVKKWINVLTKADSSDKLKSLIDLKQMIESVLKKYSELNLPAKKTLNEDSDSDTSDLEEVKPKEDFEETVSEPLPSTSTGLGLPPTLKNIEKPSDWSIISQENDVQDPTSALSTYVNSIEKTEKDSTNLSVKPSIGVIEKHLPSKRKNNPTSVSSSSASTSRKSKLLALAPKVPFDLDLYNWENEKIPSAVMRTSHPDAHNFWSTSTCEDDDDKIPKELSGTTRVIEFSGKFNPVKWTCRALLPTGKLCPRRDRIKCPFHGPIVPRDEMGNVCEVDGKLPEVQPEKPKVPDWQDPEFLRDIESQIGIDLTIPEKGKRKKKKPKNSGLTDVKATQNTTYNRLSKKIFNKATMKRVASTLDAIDHKKFRDKFGDQFNYS